MPLRMHAWGRYIQRVSALPSASVLVRTWFGDDSAWESLVSDVETPNDEGFLANVVLVNDRAFKGRSAEALKAKHPGGAIVSFVADEMTLTNGERPILAVWVLPQQAWDERSDRLTFRVVASELPSVENNINLANMDWEDFTQAVGEDGIFRGF
jgi:hypothetical protein